MKYTVYSIFASIMLAIAVSSCLGSSDYTSNTYYDDAAISAVTLGTLKQTLHTTSYTGGDSTYTTTYTGSNYPMFIDQANHLIYNIDSLPAGTHTNMLITISTQNSGTVGILSLSSDSIKTYSSSDSIDVSQPRTLYVESNDYTSLTTYTLEVRIHKEYENKFYWTTKDEEDSKLKLGDMRALAFNGKMYVYGTDGTGIKVIYSTDLNDGTSWTKSSKVLSADASMTTNGKALYAMSNGTIYTTTDGENWEATGTATNLKTLFAANKEELYAVDNDQILKSKDQGATWTVDELFDDATELPRYDICGFCKDLKTNDNAVKVMLYGNRKETTPNITKDDYLCDSIGRVWTRDYVYGSTSNLQPWYQLYNTTSASLDRYAHVSITPYGECMLALGNLLGVVSDGILISYDNGINWETTDYFPLPDDFQKDTSSFGFASDGLGYIWLINSDGNVYRGRLSQMTWSTK